MVKITDEMLNAHLKATGDWVDPFTAERESGVPVECDISQQDADHINEDGRTVLRRGYEAALAVANWPQRNMSMHFHPPAGSVLSAVGELVTIEPEAFAIARFHKTGAFGAAAEQSMGMRPDRAKMAIRIARIWLDRISDPMPDEDFWARITESSKACAFDVYDLMVDPTRWPEAEK